MAKKAEDWLKRLHVVLADFAVSGMHFLARRFKYFYANVCGQNDIFCPLMKLTLRTTYTVILKKIEVRQKYNLIFLKLPLVAVEKGWIERKE